MDPASLADRLQAIEGRVVGSDAERRAALMLAGELRRAGRRPRLTTHWVRPRRLLAFALYAAVGVAGSVVAVSSAEVGLGLAAGALLATLLERAGVPVVSLLQTRRATQNVVVAAGEKRPVLLVLAASIAAPRDGLLERLRSPRRAPDAIGLLALALAAVAACAGARISGVEGTALGVAQLVPSALLILLLGAFLDAELAGPRRPAPGSGPAAALAVARALDAQPPRMLAVELVLAGGAPGLKAYAAGRRGLRREDVVVVVLEPGDGPLRFASRHRRLTELAAAHSGAEASGERTERLARWPLIELHGEPRALAAATLRLVASIDADVVQARDTHADNHRTAVWRFPFPRTGASARARPPRSP